MKGKRRLEVRWSNGDLTAFPNVRLKTLHYDEANKALTFVYGEKKCIATIFTDKMRFLEFIDE